MAGAPIAGERGGPPPGAVTRTLTCVIAVLLVGGEGTRLRPLTWRTPKSMVPVLNRPFLEHALEHLRRHGVDEAILAVSTSPLAERIRSHFGSGDRLGMRLEYSVEQQPLGSAGAFKLLERQLSGATFLVVNGDIFTDLDLTAMVKQHHESGAVCTISLTEVGDPSGFGVVAVAPDGRITRFVEKPPRDQAPSRWINAGAWIFEPSVLRLIPPGTHTMAERQLFPQLIERGQPVYGYRSDEFWVDIGTPGRYLGLHLDLLRRGKGGWRSYAQMEPGCSVHASAVVRGRLLAGRGCRVGAGAVIEGCVVLGEGCEVGPGATIRDSVLWSGVRVGPSAEIVRSIVASGVTVAAGSSVREVVAAHGAFIEPPGPPAGTRLEPDARWPGTDGSASGGTETSRSEQ